MEQMKYAPVVIPTLHRYEHFKQCIESLKKCNGSSKTDIFIGLDYPTKDSHWDGYKKINVYVNKISGFKTVNLVKRIENYGVDRNLMDLGKRAYNISDRVIVTEDDNIFSEDFLTFINEGLERYQNRDDIYCICGYNYDIKMPRSYQNDIYLSKSFVAWGVGYWRSKTSNLDRSLEGIRAFYKNKQLFNNLKKYSEKNAVALENMHNKNEFYGDLLITLHLIKNNMYSVFPVISRVRNIGFDGSGLHCGSSKKMQHKYHNRELYCGRTKAVFPEDIEEDIEIMKLITNHYKIPMSKKIKMGIKKMINVAFNPNKNEV